MKHLNLPLSVPVIFAVAGCPAPAKYIDDPVETVGGTDGQTAGPGYEVSKTEQSGTRLRAKYDEAASGARSFLSWWDNELGVDCAFSGAEDGEVRCLPRSTLEILFTDPACTQPVVEGLAEPCDPRAKYVLDTPDRAMCSPGQDPRWSTLVYKTTMREVSATKVYGRREGQCALTGAGTLYAVDPVPASAFVQASVTYGDVGAGLGVTVYDGEDGSMQVAAVRDSVRGIECHPLEDEGSSGCFPTWKMSPAQDWPYPDLADVYADDGCIEPVYIDRAGNCPQVVQSPAGEDHLLFERGEQLYGGFFVFDPECSPASGNEDLAYYKIGDPIPKGSLPVVGTVRSGSGRIVGTSAGTVDGTRLSGAALFEDTELGTQCWALEFVDGAFRCVPAFAGEVYEFADSECSQAVMSVLPGQAPPPYAVLYDYVSCSQKNPIRQVYARAAKLSDFAVWQRLDTGNPASPCIAAEMYPEFDYYEFTEIAQDSLAVIARGIE